jgi:hypothetical protein
VEISQRKDVELSGERRRRVTSECDRGLCGEKEMDEKMILFNEQEK